MLTTDGPYAEGKEFIGGFDLIQAEDLDGALVWAGKLARILGGLPVEVRPVAESLLTGRHRPRSSARTTDRRSPSSIRLLGDIDAAEEAVQDAFLTAVQRWPVDGIPPSPAGWIVTTARNRAIDRLRREGARAGKHAEAALLRRQTEPRGGGRRARRPPPADLHLLPPGARPCPPRWRSPCGCSAA